MLFVYMTLFQHCTRWRQVTFFYWYRWRVRSLAFNENRYAVFIWSVEMCFIFVAQINVIFMRPLYEANILCDCILIVLECTDTIGLTQWRPLHKALTSGLGLDDLALAWPAVVQLVVSFNSGSQWILVSQEFFSLFYHGDQFNFYVVAMVHWLN